MPAARHSFCTLHCYLDNAAVGWCHAVEALRKLFERHGHVDSLKVIPRAGLASGFVLMGSRGGAEAACTALDG